MVLTGELAKMMVQIAPEIYWKYIAVDRKGTKMLYVKLQKALYGLLRASLLFYRKLRKELEAYGFEINPYDPCVANKMTDTGKQLTVVWHVDDLMALCEDNFELTDFSCYRTLEGSMDQSSACIRVASTTTLGWTWNSRTKARWRYRCSSIYKP